MKFGYREFFNRPDHPKWLVRLNKIAFSPVVFWPIVFAFSFYSFDAPGIQAYLMFFGINSYPLWLLFISWLSFRIFPKRKIFAALLPCIPLAFYAYAILGFLAVMLHDITEYW